MTLELILDDDRGARRATAVLGLACLLALGGCSVNRINPSETTGDVPDDYRRNHPIAIEEVLETMDVPVGLSTVRLPSGVKANINAFAQRFKASGAGVMAVVAPSGSPNELNAAGIAVEIEDVLARSGVDPRVIEYRVYQAGPQETNAPVRLAFNRVQAHTAPCGPWQDQAGENGANRHFHAFGCATQQNLAAIVANPLDLIYPRGLTPADAGRRANVLEKYRSGETFTSDLSREDGGEVAQGVGQ